MIVALLHLLFTPQHNILSEFQDAVTIGGKILRWVNTYLGINTGSKQVSKLVSRQVEARYHCRQELDIVAGRSQIYTDRQGDWQQVGRQVGRGRISSPLYLTSFASGVRTSIRTLADSRQYISFWEALGHQEMTCHIQDASQSLKDELSQFGSLLGVKGRRVQFQQQRDQVLKEEGEVQSVHDEFGHLGAQICPGETYFLLMFGSKIVTGCSYFSPLIPAVQYMSYI